MKITKNVLQNPYTKKILLPLVATASLLGGVTLYNKTKITTDIFERNKNNIEHMLEPLQDVFDNFAKQNQILDEMKENIQEGILSYEDMTRYLDEMKK